MLGVGVGAFKHGRGRVPLTRLGLWPIHPLPQGEKGGSVRPSRERVILALAPPLSTPF